MRRYTKKVDLLAGIQRHSGKQFAELQYLYYEATRSDDKCRLALEIFERTRRCVLSFAFSPLRRRIEMHFRYFKAEECLSTCTFYPRYTDCEDDDNVIQIVLGTGDQDYESQEVLPRPLIGEFCCLPPEID